MAMSVSLVQQLEKISGLTVEIDKDLKKYSTMKLNAVGDLLTVRDLDALKKTVSVLSQEKIEYRLIGWGANMLLPTRATAPYLQLDFSFDKTVLDSVHVEYVLPASVSLAVLTAHAAKFGLIGWEVFTGIPASLGGALFMNAGTNLGEIGSLVKEVRLVTKFGEEKLIKVDKNSFSYRHNHFVEPGDVIYQATLINKGTDAKISQKIKEYLEMRNKTQPLKEATCGCVFKNYHDNERGLTCRAGQFIDIIGLKGLTYKGLRVSPKHANFMENFGESNYEDVCTMIEILKKELKLQYGVDFTPEVEF